MLPATYGETLISSLVISLYVVFHVSLFWKSLALADKPQSCPSNLSKELEWLVDIQEILTTDSASVLSTGIRGKLVRFLCLETGGLWYLWMITVDTVGFVIFVCSSWTPTGA